MKIANIRMENFRCFRDETVEFNDYTCLVGANGAGKSTVLTALRIFFRDATGSPTDLLNLQEEDFHQRDTSKGVVMTVTFSDLEPEAQEDFKHYFRHGQLVVCAVGSWNSQSRSAEVKQFGQRMVMGAFREFFKAEGEHTAVGELKSIYSRIRELEPGLPPPGTKAAMGDALQTFEASHPELCELHGSEDEFYGFTQGWNLLQKYIQWVFVPAVKDASSEQLEAKRTALGLLLERTVRAKMSFSKPLADLRADIEGKYERLLEENQGALEALSESLSARLKDGAHPDANLKLSWRSDPSKYIAIQEPQAEVCAGEGQFKGTLARFGHGLQRSFLLALLQELSGCGDAGNPRLLLACEEPELYQHPPQARHLSSVLQKLSNANAQVMVSTHSPHFISGRGFQDARLLRREATEDQPCVRSATFQEVADKLAEARGEKVPSPTGVELKVEQLLQPALNEMFFASALVLVEGLEDVGYVSTYMTLTNRHDDFRRLGCHIVPTSGKGNMIYPLVIAKILDIPTFVIFDADGDDIDKPDRKAQHENDNLALLRLSGIANPDPFPTGTFQTSSLVVWPTKIGTIVRDEMGTSEWEKYEKAVREKRRLVGTPDLRKNALFIGFVLTAAYEDGKRSAILDGLCNEIIAFGREVRAASVSPARSAAV